MKIYRYTLHFSGVTSILMPVGGKIVDAVWQEARRQFSVYAEVNPEAPEVVKRNFSIVATGDDVPVNGSHIRSIVMGDGFHVYHIYEVT